MLPVPSAAMALALLLVHSPLVGPSSLERMAERAEQRGHPVALPDLTAIADAEAPHDVYVSTAVAAGTALPAPRVVVGHSGAGAFLPLIAAAVEPTALTVFVDAVVPPSSGSHRTPIRLIELLDAHTVGGRLQPWLDWWPADIVVDLLPEPADRDALRADMPGVPRSFYARSVPMPPGWADRPCGYVQLSTAYEGERAEASARGWPTVLVDGTHLSVRTHPDLVLDAIAEVTIASGGPLP